jgi:hypothetical protein
MDTVGAGLEGTTVTLEAISFEVEQLATKTVAAIAKTPPVRTRISRSMGGHCATEARA